MKIIKKVLALAFFTLVLSCEKPETPSIESTNFKSSFQIKKKSLKATLVTKETSFDKRGAHSSIVFNEKMWVLGGTSGGIHKNDVWSSKDGANWQQVIEQAKFPARFDHASVVFKDKIWVIGGRGKKFNGKDELNDIWSSTDGKQWKQTITKNKFAPRFWHTLTVFKGCLWLIGGWGETDTFSDVWRSCDGQNWVQITQNAPFGKRRGHDAIVFDDKLWVVGGHKGNTSAQQLTNDVWYSSNGYSWTQATDNAKFPPRRNHTLETNGELMWLIAGQAEQEGQIFLNDIWYSKNGTSWFEAKTSEPFPQRVYHSSVMLNKKLFVINGLGLNEDQFQLLSDVWSFEF